MKKEKSNYIKYCLRNKECAEMDGCFHIWKENPEYKDKILIYGPNGSGKSSLIKELMAKKSDNQEIMVFDDAFIHTHIFHNKMDEDGKQIIKQQLHSSKTKTLPNALKFHTKELDDLTKEKTEYTKQKEELDDNSNEWDNQLFKWFFTIISIETNKESSKGTYENFLASWKLYWNDNDFLIKDSYNQQKYNWLEGSWYWSAEKFKLKIQKNFRIDDFVLNDIRNDFIDRNKKFSKVNFFDYLQRKKSKIKENSKNISKEIDEYTKFFNGLKQKEIIFKIWHDRFNSKTKKNENVSFSPENKSKILNWYQEGIAFYENLSLNNEKCIFCFQKYLITREKIYSEFKSYNERDYKLLSNLKTIKAIYGETIFIIKEILEKIQQLKIQIPELKDKINKIVDSNKSEINFEFEKFIPNKLVSFFNEINLLLEDYLIKNKPKDESISDNFIEKQFEKDDFKKIIIEIKSARKWFGKHLSAKIDNLQGKIKDEEEKLQKELKDQLDELQKYWNFPIKIELETSENSQNTLIKILGKNKKKIIRFLSVGELKGLAIIIFFLYLKRNILKNNPENSSNKEYLIIFDDVFDGLDFTAAFRFNNLIKWLLDDIKKYNEKLKKDPTVILLTHQFDFITFFHNQYRNNDDKKNENQNDDNEKQEFDFFRLFKKNENSKSQHTFVSLNLNKLIQTKLTVLRKYLNKMLKQFEKYAFNQEERLSSDLIDQVIFWSISKLTLEIIFTNKINLQGEKVNWGKNCNQSFEKYLKELFDKSEKEKKIKEKILKILKKWKPKNETFVFISQKKNENKICNISQKNLFLMTQTIKDFLFEIKIINQTENKKFEKQINHFSNKYKKSNDIFPTTNTLYDGDNETTIELRMLEQHLKKLLEKIYSNNNEQKENLYVEYVLLQRAIFFLKEGYKEALKEKNKKIFKKALKKALEEAPKEAPKEVLKELLKKTLKETLEKILEETLEETLEEVLEEVLKEAFKEVLKKTHKETHKEALKEVLEEVLEEACANENKSQEDDSSLFTFLRHANNNFFPSLLMFDASFEKLLESKKQNKSIIIQKLLKIN